jgi:hypothetical protein
MKPREGMKSASADSTPSTVPLFLFKNLRFQLQVLLVVVFFPLIDRVMQPFDQLAFFLRIGRFSYF